jgi:hypothetical protein
MTQKDQSAVAGPKGTSAWPAETTTEPATHKPAMHVSGDLEQRIRQRAYELSGRNEGRPQGRSRRTDSRPSARSPDGVPGGGHAPRWILVDRRPAQHRQRGADVRSVL